MKKKKPSISRAERSRRLFMRRSYAIYRHMESRLKKSTAADKRAGTVLPFDRADFRLWLECFVTLPCPYCTEKVTPRVMSVDHRTPVSRGGDWGIENLEVLCASCNFAKGELTADEYSQIAAVLRTWEPKVARRFAGRLKAGAMATRLRFA